MNYSFSPITSSDLDIFIELSSKTYYNNSMGPYGEQIKILRKKLKDLVSELQNKYSIDYGPFDLAGSTGNPLSRSGSVNFPWAALCKGSDKKQYAVQLGISINKENKCLNVGFSFGRASSHNLDESERNKYESNLKHLAKKIVKNTQDNPHILLRYNNLGDLCFHYYYNNIKTTGDEWLKYASAEPNKCKIIAHIYPDENQLIEFSTIDVYISQIAFLMKCIDKECTILPPLTPKQWGKRAEEMKKIGNEGERYVLEKEKEKLRKYGLDESCVKHMSEISDSFGYDILSKDKDNNDLYIEVKSTTRLISDPIASEFYMSSNEYQYYLSHKDKYRLYRVYGLRTDSPSIVEIDMDKIDISPKDYIIKI